MRHVLVPALAILFAAALVSAQGGERGGRRGRAPATELAHFDFREVTFTSSNLADGKGQYGVYLPKGWDAEANKERRYPLIVWLHGFGGYREFQSRGAAAALDALRGAGEIPEVVVATFIAPGGGRGRSVYVNGEPSGKIEDAIAVDLVADAIEHHRVSPDRQHHAIMGISIGGFGALKIAMKHMDVFAAVGAHSSAILADDPEELPPRYQAQVGRALEMGLDEVFGDPLDKDKWAAEMPMGMARKAEKDAFARLRIYFDAGTEDRYGFAETNEQLSKLMTEKGIAHTFRLVDGGSHAWSSPLMLDNVRTSLRFVCASFAAPAKATAEQPGKDGGK